MKKRTIIKILETISKITAYVAMIGIMLIMTIVASFLFDASAW